MGYRCIAIAQVGPLLRVLGSQTSRLTNGTFFRRLKAEAEHPLLRGTDPGCTLSVPMLRVKGFLFLSSVRRNDSGPWSNQLSGSMMNQICAGLPLSFPRLSTVISSW